MKNRRLTCLALVVALLLATLTGSFALAEDGAFEGSDAPVAEEVMPTEPDADAPGEDAAAEAGEPSDDGAEPDAQAQEASEDSIALGAVDESVPVADDVELCEEQEGSTAVAEANDVMLGSDDLESADLGTGELETGDINYEAQSSVIDQDVLSLPSAAAVTNNVSIVQNGSNVTVNGTVNAPYQFVCVIWVDDKPLANGTSGGLKPTYSLNINNVSIDMNKFDTGYHTVWVAISELANSNYSTIIKYLQKVEVNKLTDAPTYTGSFEVFDTYFNYYPFNMTENQRGDLYMEYSGDNGASWARTGYMRANLIQLPMQQGYAIEGLAPNTTYMTRIFYGKSVTYSKSTQFGDDQSYFFAGPAIESLTIKTGDSAAPAIKSVKIKSVRIRKHRVRHPGYYNYVGGSLFWHRAYTEKYYTCRLKVIVKLRRKQNTNGMWISCAGQSKYLPGNRKKYTAVFDPYPNYFAKKPKNRYRYTVTIRSGQDPNWGGYSPAVTRTKKLR